MNDAFRSWFADSKVVDASGKPLVVYHGTAADFDTFDANRANGGPAVSWFSANPDVADFHAGKIAKFREAPAAVMPAFLSMQNPLVVDGQVDKHGTIQRAIEGGHDGVIFTSYRDGNAGLGDQFAVFNPGQIKSATGNSGAFDLTDPRICFKRGAAPVQAALEIAPERKDAFLSWFGDSKVVDAEGKPLVVYHGTNRDFDTFRTDTDGAVGQGAYFSPSASAAGSYAMRNGRERGGRTVPVYLSLQKPYAINGDEKHTSRKQLERRGYDGIIYKHGWNDGSKSVEYVAFNPSQIKSATANSGAFDPADPRICFKRSAPAPAPAAPAADDDDPDAPSFGTSP